MGAARGTTIEVRHLFYNVPARRKFLRTPKTELNHIRQLVLLQALSAHQIGFSLTAEGHRVYQLPRCTTPEERIGAIYSPAFLSQLKPIAYQHHDLSLSGFTGLPQTGRKDRQEQFVFINGRAAAAPIIYHAINEVYRPLLGRGRYPALFLSIEMPPDAVDVNVHRPKKRCALDIQIKSVTPYRPHFKKRYNSSRTLHSPHHILRARTCPQRNARPCRCKMR